MSALNRKISRPFAELGSSSNRGLIPPGRDGEVSNECAGHVALVREAGRQCGLSWGLACGQKLPDEAHSALNHIGVRRNSDFAHEAAQQLKSADARERRQFRKRGRDFRCGIDPLNRLEH